MSLLVEWTAVRLPNVAEKQSRAPRWFDTRAFGVAIVVIFAALGVCAAGAQAKTRAVRCVGGSDRCTATVALAGLKTGDRVVIDLTDTDLQLEDITPSRPSVQVAYGFAGLSMREGGSQLVARILIDPPVPRGASVRFRFAVPPKATSCGNDQFTIDGAPIRLTDLAARNIDCLAARRAVEGCVAGTGPGVGWTVLQVDDQVLLRRKRQRVTFGLGNARSSCAPSG